MAGPSPVAVVQGAIPQDEKWIDDNLDSILENYKTRTREAHGAALIVWPESAIPDLANNHIEYYRDVYAEASAKGSSLMMGTLRAEENARTGRRKYFNSVLAMDRSTPGVGWHDKYHLVPFTEFVPVPGFVRQWLRPHDPAVFRFQSRPGESATARGGGQRIAASVCYEDAYGPRNCRHCAPRRCS
jgi:apolipoprotein N-acyltransferase